MGDMSCVPQTTVGVLHKGLMLFSWSEVPLWLPGSPHFMGILFKDY